LTRLRLGALLALAVAFGASSQAPQAMAAAEVHRLNLVISAIPSQINGGGMNDLLARYNEYPLGARGLENLDKVTFGWLFDAEWRYFARPNFALCAGVGQLKTETKQEYLPGIATDINLRGEVLSVPIHLGGLYYLAPYTQGDFQARAFLGGGLISLTATRALFSVYELGLERDTTFLTSLGGTQRLVGTGDSPGFYAEMGAHLFFAARYSVMIGAIYRSAVVRDLIPEGALVVPVYDLDMKRNVLRPLIGRDGKPIHIRSVDLGGLGVRMAVGIGF
jgi:hypothetical protein